MQRDTCPIGGWPGRTSRPSWAAAAARAPGPWPPTTRTRRRSGSRRPGWRCAPPLVTRPIRSGSPPRCPPTWTRRTQLQLRRHCACPGDVGAYDFGGALRSGMGCLIAALRGGGTDLVVAGDMRDGLPTSADESAGGDAGAAVLVGEGPGVLAEFVAAASATDEFTDRWRAPGDRTSKLWEERFGENRYLALGQDALARALKAAGLESGDIGRLVVTGMHGRAVSGLVEEAGPGRVGGGRRPRLERGPERHGPPAPGPGRSAGVAGRGGHAGRARPWWPCTWPTGPTPWCCARPRRWPAGARRGRSPSRWPTARRSPTPSSWPGAASSSPSRPGGPSRRGCRARRPTATRSGSSASSARRTGARAPSTCRRRGSPWRAVRSTTWSRSPWPTPPARWSPPPSTGWPTRRARPSCSPSWTSTGAAGTRSS